MKQKIQSKLSRRERRLKKRIAKASWKGQSPMIDPPSIHYELADRVQAMTPGGLGLIQQMVKQLSGRLPQSPLSDLQGAAALS